MRCVRIVRPYIRESRLNEAKGSMDPLLNQVQHVTSTSAVHCRRPSIPDNASLVTADAKELYKATSAENNDEYMRNLCNICNGARSRTEQEAHLRQRVPKDRLPRASSSKEEEQ